MKILTVLREYEVKSYLTYYRMDFKDKFGNYIVFDIFYNDTDLFTEDLVYLGEGRDYSLSDSIRSRCKVVGNLKDYLNYERVLPSVDELNEKFVEKMNSVVDSIYNINVRDIIVRKVEFYSSPCLMLFIHLNYKLRRIPAMKIFIGEKFDYQYNSSTDLFVEQVRRVLFV